MEGKWMLESSYTLEGVEGCQEEPCTFSVDRSDL